MFAVPPNTVALSGTPASAHPALIAGQYAVERSRWADLLSYDPDERFAILVDKTDEQEVWLMSWLPGQSTDAHDHGAATGAFTLVSGALTERVLRPDGPIEELHLLREGQTRVFGPGYAHQVHNAGIDPAVSIHVYRSARPRGGGYSVDPVI